MSKSKYILHESGTPFPAGNLVAALDEFTSAERYSSRRDQILREIRDRPFATTVLFQTADRTYGYTTDDRFRNGQTLSAILEGSSHTLSLQMPATLNKQLSNSRVNDPIRVTLLITKWNSVADSFEGQVALDIPDSSSAPDVPSPEPVLPPANQDGPPHDVPSGEEAPATSEQTVDPIASPAPENPVVDEAPDLTVENDTADPLPRPPTQTATVPPVIERDEVELAEHKRVLESLHLELTTGTTPLAASSLAKYIGLKSGIDVDVAERVITSFWSYYLTPFRFMEGHLVVNIPLIGSFTLYRKTGGSRGLTLKQIDSGILATAQKTINSMRDLRWIEDYHGNSTIPEGKGNESATVAISLAEEHNIDIRASYTIVLELLALVTTLISIGTRRIRWPGIGEMYPARGPAGGTTYRFRVYKNLLRALASVPLEKYASLAGSADEDDNLDIRTRREKKKKSSTASGCLFIFAGILFFVFVMNDGCRTVLRSFGSIPAGSQQQLDHGVHEIVRPVHMAAIPADQEATRDIPLPTRFTGVLPQLHPGTSQEPR